MSFSDSISDKIRKGTAAMNRAVDRTKRNNQIDTVNRQRQQLAAQLGASLYEETKDNSAFRSGRESLYDSIAECDAQRAALQAQLADLDAAASADETLVCPNCHSQISAGDRFCSGCGMPVEQIRAQQQASASESQTASPATCPRCGTPIVPGSQFCTNCGYRLDEGQTASSGAPAPDNAPAE